jgi:chorismate mutase
MPEKEDLRRQIDALDKELLALLNRRQSLAQVIGRIKTRRAPAPWTSGGKRKWWPTSSMKTPGP